MGKRGHTIAFFAYLFSLSDSHNGGFWTALNGTFVLEVVSGRPVRRTAGLERRRGGAGGDKEVHGKGHGLLFGSWWFGPVLCDSKSSLTVSVARKTFCHWQPRNFRVASIAIRLPGSLWFRLTSQCGVSCGTWICQTVSVFEVLLRDTSVQLCAVPRSLICCINRAATNAEIQVRIMSKLCRRYIVMSV